MSVFLIVMIVGMFGLGLMAVPGIARGHGIHAHGGAHTGTHTGTHAAAGHTHNAPGNLKAGAAKTGASNANITAAEAAAEAAIGSSLRWFPSPRSVFSVMTLFGGFGFAFESGAHMHEPLAALLAIVPAILIERFAVTPAWNALMQFEGQPSSPLEDLTLQDAVAVTVFRNGKGMVSVVRDERAVQLLAVLREDQQGCEVRVGDRLRIEQVDSARERVTVAVI